MPEIKVNISAALDEVDEVLKQKIINFTSALNELPHNLHLDFKIYMDKKECDNTLKINLGQLLTEQVKEHFSKKDSLDVFRELDKQIRLKGRI
jgi:hypothetical protein